MVPPSKSPVINPVVDQALFMSAAEELEMIGTKMEGMLIVVEKEIYETMPALDDSIDIRIADNTPRSFPLDQPCRSPPHCALNSGSYPFQDSVSQSGSEPLLPLQPLHIYPSFSPDDECSSHRDILDVIDEPKLVSNVAREERQSTQVVAILPSVAPDICSNDSPLKGVYFTNIDRNELLPVRVLTRDLASSQKVVKVYGLERRHFCHVCHDPFIKPMTTRCGHTFCAECIYACTLYWKPHTCPICMELLPSVPYINDEMDATIKTLLELECNPSLAPKCGDLVQVLTTSSHVYAFEIGFLRSIQDGYINESRQQVILPSDIQSKTLNPGPKFLAEKIATVDVGGRLWFGRLADMIRLNLDSFPLGTRPTPGSIVIDSRKLNLKLFDRSANRNKIECDSTYLLRKSEVMQKHTSDSSLKGNEFMQDLYNYDSYCTNSRKTNSKDQVEHLNNCLNRLSRSSQERYTEIFEELQKLPVIVTDLAQEARKNMDFDSNDYIFSPEQPKIFSGSEFPCYFERPENSGEYHIFESENASTYTVKLWCAHGQETVNNICPYLTVITNLSMWNRARDFCCVGCKQLLRLPVKLKCGHLYCYNCALDSLKMGWPCLGCGIRLALETACCADPQACMDKQLIGTSSMLFYKFIPILRGLVDILASLFPFYDPNLDKWQPVRINQVMQSVGILYDNPLQSTVRVLLEPNVITTVSVTDLIPLDLRAFRPALRSESGLILINPLFQSRANPYISPQASNVESSIANIEPPCEFFDQLTTTFSPFTYGLVKARERTRVIILARNGPLLLPLQNMIDILLTTSLQFVPDFSHIFSLFRKILTYITEIKSQNAKKLIHKQYYDRYMTEFSSRPVKSDPHIHMREESVIIEANAWKNADYKGLSSNKSSNDVRTPQQRVLSIAQPKVKIPQRVLDYQRCQALRNGRSNNQQKLSVQHPLSAQLITYKDILIMSEATKQNMAEFRREESRLLKLVREQPQLEANVSAFASLLKVCLNVGANDFLCTACNQILRAPCRLPCGHLVCRSCAVIYYVGEIGCLSCGAKITAVHSLRPDQESLQQVVAYIPRYLQCEQIDKGTFVVRIDSRKAGLGIVLSTTHRIGTDYAVVRFVENTITVRISELQSILPKWRLGDAIIKDSSIPDLHVESITPSDALIGTACVYWPPTDLIHPSDSTSSFYRGLFGLVCDYTPQTARVMFEVGVELEVPPNHLFSLQLIGPVPMFEMQRRWHFSVLKAKADTETYERNRAIELQILMSLDHSDVRDLNLAAETQGVRPRVRVPPCNPEKLPDFRPPSIFFSDALAQAPLRRK